MTVPTPDTPGAGDPDQGPNQPAFDQNAAHQQTPKLRKVRGFPLPAQGPDGKQQVFLGIADAQQISPKMIATSPAFQAVLPLMDGSRSIDQIVSEVGRGLSRPMMEHLIAQLDDAALIEGPTFDAMLEKVRADFDASETLPPASTAQLADALVMQEFGQEATDEQKAQHAPAKLGAAMDQWVDAALKDADNPSLDALPKAIVAPHIDYPRGWMNYGAIWGRLRVVDRPDRVVVLGTNHFGQATGVCGCDKGYQTPLGTCPVATDLVEALRRHLGNSDAEILFRDRYDHENEHSIELQVPWIQHVFGTDDAGSHVPVFGALIHDPTVNNGASYDGAGLGLDRFVAGMRAAIEELGGRTLVVSSADLSHVGPAFGDQQNVAAQDEQGNQFRQQVAQTDQEMLKVIVERRPDDLVSSMAWQQNPTRWCSIGNLVATMKIVEPESVELLNYAAAVDQQGATMVSSAALVMR